MTDEERTRILLKDLDYLKTEYCDGITFDDLSYIICLYYVADTLKYLTEDELKSELKFIDVSKHYDYYESNTYNETRRMYDLPILDKPKVDRYEAIKFAQDFLIKDELFNINNKEELIRTICKQIIQC